MSESEKPFHVLALSGGGFRSLYTATVLEKIEESLGHPIAKHFDLICGTSAGGLIALALALEIPAAQLKTLFKDQGKVIFGKRSLARRVLGLWFMAKHSDEGLRKVLATLFNNELRQGLLGDVKHPVIIPAVNYSTGKAQIFKSPHHPTLETDHKYFLVDVALATAAAPTYFPVNRSTNGTFVDGGLIANAPGYFGWHEARHFLSADSETVRVLSVGTMSSGRTRRGGEKLDKGIFCWREHLFDLILSAQESTTDYLLSHELKNRYLVVDEKPTPDQAKDISKLDNPTTAALETLISRGAHSAQRLLGSVDFQPFRNHLAPTPKFYFGPHAN